MVAPYVRSGSSTEMLILSISRPLCDTDSRPKAAGASHPRMTFPPSMAHAEHGAASVAPRNSGMGRRGKLGPQFYDRTPKPRPVLKLGRAWPLCRFDHAAAELTILDT
jgi:hypothetical protein